MVELDKIFRASFENLKDMESLSFIQIFPAFILSLVFIFLVIVVSTIIQRKIYNRINDVILRQRYKKYISYTSIVIIITGFLIIWSEPIKDAIVILSAFTVGIIIGFKEIIVCLSGRFLISVNKSYDIGDRIEIAGKCGDVIDMGIFDTTLLEVGGVIPSEQSSGRIIYIPHSLIITGPVINYSRKGSYIWDEIIFKLDPAEDWWDVKKILCEQCEKVTGGHQEEIQKDMEEHTREFAYKLPPLTPIVYTDLAEGKVILSLRYMVKIRQKRKIRQEIIEEILLYIKEREIKLY